MKGIDVSVYQGNINWGKVAPQIDFAILRAGIGNEIDDNFIVNVLGCQQYNIPYGAYWYIIPGDTAYLYKQAYFFAKIMKLMDYKPLYPLYADIESEKFSSHPDNSVTHCAEIVCPCLESQGFYAGIYCNYAYYLQFDASIWQKYDRWLAWINDNNPPVKSNMIQYSWKGKIEGISTDVDLDECTKDYPAIIRKAGLNGWLKNE